MKPRRSPAVACGEDVETEARRRAGCLCRRAAAGGLRQMGKRPIGRRLAEQWHCRIGLGDRLGENQAGWMATPYWAFLFLCRWSLPWAEYLNGLPFSGVFPS